VLLAQIASCGVSLNLQHGGNRIIVVEEDFSPAVMDQFYARLLRMGQKDHVHADVLVTDTKLDKAVGKISSRKRSEHGILLKQEEAA
jgi:SNF2 family DNA or RNA helicase